MGQRYTTCTMYVIQTYESQWEDWCSSGERPGQAPEDWRNKFSVSSALDVINKENMVYCFSSGKFHFFSWHPSQSLWVLCRYCERLSACWDGWDKSYWLWWCTYCLSNMLNWLQMYREKRSFRWFQKVLPTSTTAHFCVLWLFWQNWKILHCTNEQQLLLLLGPPWDSTAWGLQLRWFAIEENDWS